MQTFVDAALAELEAVAKDEAGRRSGASRSMLPSTNTVPR
jgi:hypothetical protein